MELILGIIYLLFLGYFALLVFYLRSWNAMPTPGENSAGVEKSVSVIVPVRNEASGIKRCIDSILKQDYKAGFNVIIVDDHSSDETLDIVSQNYTLNPTVSVISLAATDLDGEGKKVALSAGIEKAEGEIIVTTDGDCEYSASWLTTLMHTFGDSTQIVTGPVVYPVGDKILAGFQALDLLSLIMATVAGIRSRYYFLGNGANLAFRRSAFDAVHGYEGNEDHVSGDDMFLIQKIVKHFGTGSVAYAKSSDAAVLTDPQLGIFEFVRQRIRWASKNRALEGRQVYYLWAFLWLVNVGALALLIFGVLGYSPLLAVGVFIYFKMMLEGVALYRVAKFFDMVGVMRWYPWSFFINILYVSVIGIMANLSPSFKWKGRHHK